MSWSPSVGNWCTDDCVEPSGRISRGATAPVRGSARPASSSAAMAPSVASMSAFDAASHSDWVRRATAFTARPKPRLPPVRRRCAHGCSRSTSSGEPSLDSLSATHTSASPASAAGWSERRQASSSSRVFQETTAITSGADTR
jgi:hypothetical protein